MPSIHDVLDNCQKQCETMVKEIQTFKSARVMHEQSTLALTQMAEAMKHVTKQIHPFTERRLKTYVYLSLVTLILNSLMIFGFISFLILKRS